jgi:hypothetical protein
MVEQVYFLATKEDIVFFPCREVSGGGESIFFSGQVVVFLDDKLDGI